MGSSAISRIRHRHTHTLSFSLLSLTLFLWSPWPIWKILSSFSLSTTTRNHLSLHTFHICRWPFYLIMYLHTLIVVCKANTEWNTATRQSRLILWLHSHNQLFSRNRRKILKNFYSQQTTMSNSNPSELYRQILNKSKLICSLHIRKPPQRLRTYKKMKIPRNHESWLSEYIESALISWGRIRRLETTNPDDFINETKVPDSAIHLIDCSRKKITALIILKNLEKKNKKQKN